MRRSCQRNIGRLVRCRANHGSLGLDLEGVVEVGTAAMAEPEPGVCGEVAGQVEAAITEALLHVDAFVANQIRPVAGAVAAETGSDKDGPSSGDGVRPAGKGADTEQAHEYGTFANFSAAGQRDGCRNAGPRNGARQFVSKQEHAERQQWRNQDHTFGSGHTVFYFAHGVAGSFAEPA